LTSDTYSEIMFFSSHVTPHCVSFKIWVYVNGYARWTKDL